MDSKDKALGRYCNGGHRDADTDSQGMVHILLAHDFSHSFHCALAHTTVGAWQRHLAQEGLAPPIGFKHKGSAVMVFSLGHRLPLAEHTRRSRAVPTETKTETTQTNAR
jgi:hypothetical protein